MSKELEELEEQIEALKYAGLTLDYFWEENESKFKRLGEEKFLEKRNVHSDHRVALLDLQVKLLKRKQLLVPTK